jgi:hypothetical protein
MTLPSNSLFSIASRQVQESALERARSSGIFKTGRDVRTILASKDAPGALRQFVGNRLKKSAFGRAANDVSELIEQFAKGGGGNFGRQIGEKVFQQVFAQTGPIADVVRLILGMGGKVASSAQTARDLSSMIRALQAFGFEVIHKPTKQAPPTPREIEAAKRVLEAAGYEVSERKKPGQAPEVHVNRPQTTEQWLSKNLSRKKPADVEKELDKISREEFAVGNATVKRAKTGTLTIKQAGSTERVPPTDPLFTGEMIPVNSSNVHSIGYDLAETRLKIRFLATGRNGKRSGAGPMYFYYQVPMRMFKRLRTTGSKGTWVWDHLRIRGTVSGHQFDYSLAGLGQGNYIPRKATYAGSGKEVYMPRQFMVNGKTRHSRFGYQEATPFTRGVLNTKKRRRGQ